jgi:hypothetical protein
MKPVAMVMEGDAGAGLEAAVELAREGFLVFASVLALDQSMNLSRRARERGVDVALVTMDPASPESIARAVAEVLSYTGRVDVLVAPGGRVLEAALDAVVPTMKAAGRGRIVGVASAPLVAAQAHALRDRLGEGGLDLVLVDEQVPQARVRAVVEASTRGPPVGSRLVRWLGL